MADTLPYLAAPGTITTCLEKISNAATPSKVTGDFVNTKLAIKGGSGRALVPFLKKIGFVNSDGTPSDIYTRFRNPSESGSAIAEAIRFGYKSLYDSNEYAHDLNDADLKGLVVQVTGQESDSNVVSLILRTYKNLRELADFEGAASSPVEPAKPLASPITIPQPQRQAGQGSSSAPGRVGMNLSYTINLNLPATSDISVFNAIFKSLKENLLDSDELE
ncbi:MAG: DUF5343 domain-containing protein [Verrucomicrobiae bacterium]|nr:DUF5343 domain-containing protein [Verrucomicrobiae bacterium]